MAARLGLAGRVHEGNAKWWALIAACFGLFMAILDNLVVNIALPTLSEELDATATQLQWVVSAYILVFASVQITAGGLGDRFGRKRWFLIGLAIFTATSFLAALSQNVEMLIAMRALQGLGAAFIMPLSLSLISAAFPPEERGRAIGIWSAISVSGVALGPVIGGALIEYASWEWVFLINVPIGIAAFLVTQAVVRESFDESGTVATDIPGTVLITGAIASVTYGLIEAGERGWGDGLILGSFLLSAILSAAFIWVENRTEKPMVPLRFFRSSTFTGANLDAFSITFLMIGVFFFLTLYQQNVHDMSAVRTGLALLPMVAAMMIFSPIMGNLVNRVGARRMISAGLFISGIGALLLLRTGVDATYWDIVPAFVVMGFGMSGIWAPMMTAVLNSVESDKAGVASAINGAIREIGSAFSIAFLGTMMNRTYQSAFDKESSIQALRNDPNATAYRPVIDAVGDGNNMAGHVIEKLSAFDFVPADIKATLVNASSKAFVDGMDVAIYIGAIAALASAVLSYFLVKDSIFEQAPVTEIEPAAAAAEALSPIAAD